MVGTSLARTLRESCEAIADDAVAAVRREVPALATVASPDGLRRTIVRGMRRFAEVWEAGRTFASEELDDLVRPTVALHGSLDRDDALHALRVIIDVCRDHYARRLADLDPASALLFLQQGEAARRLSTVLLDEVDTRLHRADAGSRLGRLQVDAMLFDVLLAPDADLRRATELAQEHGIATAGRWDVAVVVGPVPDDRLLRLRLRADRLPGEALIAARGDRVVVAVTGVPLSALVAEGVPAGLSTAADLSLLRPAFDEAVSALRIGRLRGRPVAFEDALLSLVLLGERPAEELARRLRAALDDPDADRSAWLVDTLEAYLDEGGSVTAAARRLQLHRESLRYRLQQLEARLGRRLQDADERLALHMAVKTMRLLEA